MDENVLIALRSFPKIHTIEAYTGRHLGYTVIDGLDLNRIVEVRFRACEMPEVYYETEHALKMLRKPKVTA